jgi:hypothetical protein
MSKELPNRDLRGTPNKMRTRCCGWCLGDWQCLSPKAKKKAKKQMIKKLRRYIDKLIGD